ncbi:Lamin tail domain-containing protein [Melia azedarach]|uniref:Lamin tail domain-containing protein n=1 Tax=Melia azedarach TaxID=155640 RepID=A0ACC1YD93_MELAZ|nr:Lamin tail domain-containing protein [Melia azedarach]
MALLLQNQNHNHQLPPVFRTSSSDSFGYMEQMEKRQLFLRSYQFCRKKSVTERIRSSFFRVKRVMWLKLRSARRIRKLVWWRFRWGFNCKRRRFLRLINNTTYYHYHNQHNNCFW